MDAAQASPRRVSDEIVTRQELAQAMRVSVRSVDRMRAEGMPVINWNGHAMVRFRLREAMAWAESNCTH